MTDFMRIVMEGLLGFQVGTWDCVASCANRDHVAHAAMVQQTPRDNALCGWIGVSVSPITTAFAESLGMAEPYGAIFDQPELGSPAAAVHIEQGDVLTSINGSPLMRSSDFAAIISAMAPGAQVYLYTWRDGEARQITLTVGSTQCRTNG
jgi:serine protease Do